MSRYDIYPKKQNSNVNINGTLNPSKLKENGVDVLTIANIAKDLNDDNKVPSVKLLKYIIENSKLNTNINSNNQEILNDVTSIFLKTFLDNINREKQEVLIKSNILTDSEITPELVNDEIRNDLIMASMKYEEKYNKLEEYITYILNNKVNIDEEVEEKINEKTNYYKDELSNISYITQIAINRLAQIKSDIALEEANKHTNSIANQIVYKLEIHSSKGSMFKKGNIDTTLTAVLYKGKEIVTEEFLPIRFVWTRTSSDKNSDDRWNSSARRDYSIRITNSDMNGNQCTFNCTVLDEEGNKIVSAY